MITIDDINEVYQAEDKAMSLRDRLNGRLREMSEAGELGDVKIENIIHISWDGDYNIYVLWKRINPAGWGLMEPEEKLERFYLKSE